MPSRPFETIREDDVQFLTSRALDTAARTRASSIESSVTIGREEVPQESFRLPSGPVIRRDDLIQVHPFLLGAHKVEFVLVKIIARAQDGTTKLCGIPLARSRVLFGRLPNKINELFMILHVQRLGSVAAEPHLVDVLPQSIIKKRTLTLTNLAYKDEPYSPWARFQHIRQDRRRRIVESRGHLMCRWKLTIYFTPTEGRIGRADESSLERLQWAEASLRHRLSEDTLCNRWRGGRIKGGSWRGRHTAVVDVDTLESTVRVFGQKYTIFDSFSGAGGVSRGAQSAGFHVQGAVDKSAEVWQTYRLNFPYAELFTMSIDQFIHMTSGRTMRPDVLHLSPPCQFFSPAHTHNSAQDDTNIFALFSCQPLIYKLRPRLITLEQTFGLTHDRHDHYLRTLIGDFTEQGYSVRWKIVRLATWGLAQSRKRLIMIAAGPGEKLPPFPEATHSEFSGGRGGGGGGLKRFTTVRQAISGLRRGEDLHDISRTRHYNPPRPRLNADGLMGTITTGGSESYYPDGTRDFTLREYACLQGFPRNHQFRGTATSIKRQIGNAFPPNTVEVLYRHLKEWLLKEDGISARYQLSPDADVVVLD